MQIVLSPEHHEHRLLLLHFQHHTALPQRRANSVSKHMHDYSMIEVGH